MNVDVEIPEFTTESLTKTITTNGTYNYTPTTDGFSSVDITVDVEGGGGSDIDFSMIYDNDTNDKISQNIRGDIEYTKSIELPPNTNTEGVYQDNHKMVYAPQYWNDGTIFGSGSTSMKWTFSNCKFLQYVPMINTSNVTSMYGMFEECVVLPTIPQLDTSNVIDMGYMFYDCYSLQTIPQLDTSNVRIMRSMFFGCISLPTIPQLDTSNVTSMVNMFMGCDSLQTIPQLDTSNVTSMYSMFWDCSSLQTIPQLDTSNVTDMWGIFNGCRSLLNLGGFKNLKVSLDLSQCTQLTHDSLVNVINGLATVTQSTELKLGTTNLSKLTPDEIEIATNKGWIVS